MSNTRITLADVIDAMEKNGFEKIKGEYQVFANEYDPKKGKVTHTLVGGCALGQAAHNLGANLYDLTSKVSAVHILNQPPNSRGGGGYDLRNFFDWVVYHNDKTNMKISTIAKRAREYFKDYLDQVVM